MVHNDDRSVFSSEVSRRTLLAALGVAGAGVSSTAQAIEERTTSRPPENTYGWVLQHRDYHEIEKGTPPTELKRTQNIHFVDYLSAQWTEVGNPDPDATTAGCWKHTFALSAVGAGVTQSINVEQVLQDPVPDPQFKSTSIELYSDSEHVAVSKRRDPHLFNFIRGGEMEAAMREEDGYPAGVDLLESIAEEPNSYTTEDLGKFLHERRKQRERAQKLANTGMELIGAGLKTWSKVPSPVSTFYDTARKLLAKVPAEDGMTYPDEGSRETFQLDDTAAGTGHTVLFDVYVSPGETASFVLQSEFGGNFQRYYPDDHEKAGERAYFPDPTWEIEVAGPEEPEAYDELTVSSGDFTATPLGGGETTVDIHLHQKGQPIAEFDIEGIDAQDSVVPPGTTATLNAELSVSPDGPIEEYRWKIADVGSPSDSEEAALPPKVDNSSGVQKEWSPSKGRYKIVLEVEDWEGLTDEQERVVAVTDVPEVDASIAPDDPFVDLSEITFDAGGTEVDHGKIESYYWTIYQGPVYNRTLVAESNEKTFARTFEEAGDYIVELEATDSFGASSQTTERFTVSGLEEIGLSISPDPTYAGDTVTIEASGLDGEFADLRHSWRLTKIERGETRIAIEEDGSDAFSYEFDDPGSYKIYYKIWNGDEAVFEEVALFSVEDGQPELSADVEMSPDPGFDGETIELTAVPRTSDGRSIEQYTDWSIRDTTTNTEVRSFSSGKSHTTTLPSGEYRIALTITDTHGHSSRHTGSGYVIKDPEGPDAQFSISPGSPTEGETITFDASSTTAGDGSIESYSWSIRDSTTQTEVRTLSGETASTSLYSGEYRVKLVVTDENDLVSTQTQSGLDVEEPKDPNQGPDASLSANKSYISFGEPVTFDASGSSDSDGSIVDYSWSGASGSGSSVRESYYSSGKKTVTVTVEDDDGATDTASASVTVN